MHLSAGTYYLGDPCYAFTNERWSSIVDSTDSDHIIHIDSMIAFATCHGDGTYQCELGDVLVDSGMIGLVPIDIADKTPAKMFIVSFDHEVICKNQNGKLIFGHIVIDTTDEQENDEVEL